MVRNKVIIFNIGMILHFFILIAKPLPVLGISLPKIFVRSSFCQFSFCQRNVKNHLMTVVENIKKPQIFSFLFCDCVIRLPMDIHLENRTYNVSLLLLLLFACYFSKTSIALQNIEHHLIRKSFTSLIQNSAFPSMCESPLAPVVLYRKHSPHLNDLTSEFT